MMNPVILPCVPSCFEALAWSADGDFAVAAGEYVQILVSKSYRTQGELREANAVSQTLKPPNKDHSGPLNQNEWSITRLRVNLFTQAEWQYIQPQNRDDFSIGAEQSTSTVVGLAWSPPGLARFRRSVLAVLTSNLLLSLWESAGMPGQWNRVAVINHAFHLDPTAPAPLSGLELRRSNIRSFQWCPPLHVPPRNSGLGPQAESRWGVHLLMVINDANEAVLLRIQRSAGGKDLSVPYSVQKLALYPFDNVQKHYPQSCPGSLLEKALQIKARALSVSCGPWLAVAEGEGDEDPFSATAMIAVSFGTRLRTFKALVTLQKSDQAESGSSDFVASAKLVDHSTSPAAPSWTSRPVSGPIRWAYAVSEAR